MRHNKGVVIKVIEVVHVFHANRLGRSISSDLAAFGESGFLSTWRLGCLCKAESHQWGWPPVKHPQKSMATCSATMHFTVQIILSTSLSNSSSFLLVGRRTFILNLWDDKNVSGLINITSNPLRLIGLEEEDGSRHHQPPEPGTPNVPSKSPSHRGTTPL